VIRVRPWSIRVTHSPQTLALIALLSTQFTACGGSSNTLDYSFVVLGCGEVDGADLTPQNPSTANLAQLERSLSEIAALQPPPNLVFFIGDLVYGLTPDLNVLRAELLAWVQVYRASPLGQNPSIRLVALPGHHELLQSQPDNQPEVSNPGAEQVWLDVMAPFIAGDNGPPAGGPDNLQTDQSRLTYSFNFRDTHFIVLNTDPYGDPASVPVNWITDDLVTARLNGAVTHIFAVGHKPAFTPANATPDDSLDSQPNIRNPFWDALNNYDANAYFTAHSQVYSRSRPSTPTEPTTQRTWQVVAGNAGGSVDPMWTESGATPYYGYTAIGITTSGLVLLTGYGHNFDQSNYLAPSPPLLYPTTVRDTADITFP